MTEVLVLEDDENLRELLCETLEDEGYRTDGAASGTEAIAKVSARSYDAMIVDVRMEGMSGLEAFAYMRQQGAELACLVITGYATEEDSIRAIRLGVGDYLRKPFEMSELLQRLGRVVAMSARQRQSWQREQSWRQQGEWLHAAVYPEEARRAGERAAQIASALQMDPLQCLELRWAASLLCAGQVPPGASGCLGEALEFHAENWDGSGPRGLSEEAIPLPARIVRLALVAGSLSVEEVRTRFAGQIDPDLLFALELDGPGDLDRQLRRLLELARGLVQSGQTQEAMQALRRAEALASGPSQAQVSLLLAGLEPGPLRLQRLRQLIAAARSWPGRQEASVLAQAGLLLLEGCADEGAACLREAAAHCELPLEQRALAVLGLWSVGQAPASWNPEESLALLLRPEHEPHMFRALPWLAPALLRWWLAQTETPPVVWRWLRHSSIALLPALRALSPAQRVELLHRMQTHGQAPPALLLALSQEPDPQVKSLAVQIAHRPSAEQRLPPLHIRSFGSFNVFVGGRPATEKAFRGIRNKIVFAYLCSSPRPVSEERLRETFWPEDLEKGRKGLYNALFHIRRALRPEGWSGDRDYVCRQQEQLGIDPELEPWHDLWEVEQSLTRWKQLELPALQREVERVLSLTEAPYLDGCYMDWALERRSALEAQLTNSLWQACERAAQAEAWQPLFDWCSRLLLWDPEHQSAAVGRMRALCALGRPEEALRTFEQVSRRLRQELDLEPSTEMLEWQVRARMLM